MGLDRALRAWARPRLDTGFNGQAFDPLDQPCAFVVNRAQPSGLGGIFSLSDAADGVSITPLEGGRPGLAEV